jgi:hypothetical protein
MVTFSPNVVKEIFDDLNYFYAQFELDAEPHDCVQIYSHT